MYLDSVKQKGYSPIVTLGLMAIVLYTLVQNAWLSDDSFITLVQVLNLHNGDGLVFNYEQRVQAFTHPTWFALISLLTYISGEYYYTITALSIALSLGAMLILYTYATKYHNLSLAFIAIFLLLCSKSFVDYTTSGLENPLSYLLFATLLYMLLPDKSLSKKRLWIVYLLLTLLFFNRMDYALILLPIGVYLLYRYKSRNIYPLLLSGAIVLAWFLFSLLYFGHIFPNTYYAKLHTGFATIDYIQRGVNYFKIELFNDPLTLMVILVSLIFALKRGGIHKAFGFGMLFYMLYFFKSGGDFMQGRFFAILLFIAAFLLLDTMKIRAFATLAIVAFIATLISGGSKTLPLLSDATYSNKKIVEGIADERGFYYHKYGLLSTSRFWPNITFLTEDRPKHSMVICNDLGATSVAYRDRYYIIDYCALSDPLLSQLPAINHPKWRVGHQVRKIPIGYDRAVVDDSATVADKEVAELYEDIKSIVSTDRLFLLERLKAIYRVNFHDYNIDREKFKHYEITDALIDQSVYNLRILKGYQKK